MRLHHGVPMLAAVLALAGTSAPTASAFERVSNGTPSGQAIAGTQHHSGDTTDWVLGITAAAGIAVLGTGLAAKRHRAHDGEHAPTVPAS